LKKIKRYFLIIVSFLLLTGSQSMTEISMDLSSEALIVMDDNLNQALSLSRQSLVADPSNAYAWAVGGRILMKSEKNKEAFSYFERSLSINPLLKEALYWSAEIDILFKDIVNAEKKLDVLKNSCSECGESEILEQSIVSFKKRLLDDGVTTDEKKPNG